MLRAQHAEATRRAVLAAARSLFGRKGYAETSVDQIADAARVTKGAVYHHFASKKDLFRAVYTEVDAEAIARAVRVGDSREPPLDQLVAKVNAYLDAALDDEIRRITLIDAPALGIEPEASPDLQAASAGVRSSPRLSRTARSPTLTPMFSLTSSGVWRGWAACLSRAPATLT